MTAVGCRNQGRTAHDTFKHPLGLLFRVDYGSSLLNGKGKNWFDEGKIQRL